MKTWLLWIRTDTPCLKKNIPNIIDCHLKKCLPILIIFDTTISGTTGNQITGHFTTSPNICFCTTRGKLNQRNMRWNEQKYVKKHPQNYRLWREEGWINFNNFWCKYFHTTAHQTIVLVSTSPNVCFCTTWENQNKWYVHWSEQKKTLINFISLNPWSLTASH